MLGWHAPWAFFEQVYNPYYSGEIYRGPGCRSCGPGMVDCMTVATIATALGIES